MSIGAVINTNIMSLNAQRNLSSSQGELATSLERLSSGLRINSAKDDAAGLAIAERFTAQINGQNQAIRNSNDGISFSQTAEGALDEVSNLLQRVRELSVQSANDTNSASDREALNQEVEQAVSEIQRIAESTQFNGQNVLDGSLSDLLFQVGANRGQTIGVSGVDSQTDQLGVTATDGSAVNTEGFSTLTAADFSINGETIDVSGLSSISEVVDKINASTDDTGVTAKQADGQVIGNTGATSGDIDVSPTTTDGTVTMMSINGTDIDVDAGETVSNVDEAVAKINEYSDTTDVTASNEGGNLVLTSGDAIEITDVQDGADLAAGNGIASGGTDSVFGSASDNVTFDNGLELSAELGSSITLADGESNNANLLNLGLSQNDSTSNAELAAADFDVENMSVETRQDASDAIRTADQALQQVSGLRSELGAVQNRFEATIANLSVSAENLEAARSRIQDTDFAKETAELTRAQILQQAGTSILSQANAVPQTVLGLLQ